MKENRMLPIGTETFRIFVDEAEDGVIRGRVSGGTLPEETLFRSLSRLIDPAFGRAAGYRRRAESFSHKMYGNTHV